MQQSQTGLSRTVRVSTARVGMFGKLFVWQTRVLTPNPVLSQARQCLSLLHKECLSLGLLWLCLPAAEGTLEVTEQCPASCTQGTLSSCCGPCVLLLEFCAWILS